LEGVRVGRCRESKAQVLPIIDVPSRSTTRRYGEARGEAMHFVVAMTGAAFRWQLDLMRPATVHSARRDFPGATAHFAFAPTLTPMGICSHFVPALARMISMTLSAPKTVNGNDDWEGSIDQVLTICDNDPRAALRTLLIANEYLHGEVERLEAMISWGYRRRAQHS
jgi:hypothetical protein